MKEVIGDIIVQTDEHFVTVSVDCSFEGPEIVLCIPRKKSEGLGDFISALNKAVKED